MLNWLRRGQARHGGLLPFADALEAVGDRGAMGRYDDEIPLDQVVGSVARSQDFDRSFRPRTRTERSRRASKALDGSVLPPIETVRLGQLYFVYDGHHRVAAARERGWTHLPSRVRRICTVAYVCSALTEATLPSKAAERRFLEEVPIADSVRRHLWLDRPADWDRIREAARAWRSGEHLKPRDSRSVASRGSEVDPHTLAGTWWDQEVVPTVDRIRRDGGAPSALLDIQVYVTALGWRDGVADLGWPSPHWCPDHEPQQS